MSIPSKDSKTGDGKPRWSLLPYEALEEVLKVMEHGNTKYPVDSWKAKTGDYGTRYKNAAQRHLVAMMKGEEIDPESGLPHAAHLACNALFLTQFVKDDFRTKLTAENYGAGYDTVKLLGGSTIMATGQADYFDWEEVKGE